MTNLNEMKTKELKEMAKELKVKNWWTLKKTDLINEIAIAIGDREDEGEDVNVDQIAQEAIETANDESTNEPEEATQNESETDQNNNLVPMPGAEKLANLKAQNKDEKAPKKQRGKDLIEWNGKTQNLSQWAKELGMPGQTLFARIHLSGWTVEKAFTTPVKKRNKKEA